MSSTNEVTVQLVTEFEPESVIYNIDEYNRTYIGVLTFDGCCLFEVLVNYFLKKWKTFLIAMC